MKNISECDVVVIGAGAAGLAATAELIKHKKSVICVEAMDRIGGRCSTDNKIFEQPFDIGAHWLHSYSNNQIAHYGLTKKDVFEIYKIDEKITVYEGNKKSDGKELFNIINKIKNLKNNYSQKKLQEHFDQPFEDLIPIEIRNNEWYATAHQALGACLEGVDFKNFTTADAQLNYKNNGEGDGFVKQGYGTLLSEYRKDVPVYLSTIVKNIIWSDKVLKIETNKGTIRADTCIVTVPNAVLSSGTIKFTPLLPSEKYDAFDGISLGLYNHIVLEFENEFYKYFNIQKDEYFFSKINSSLSSPPGCFGSLRLHDSNLSYFDVGGEFALELEKEGEKASINFVLEMLCSTLGSKIKQYFLRGHSTAWGKNVFFQGSYSSAKPGKAHLRKILRKPIDDKIFFAGEATSYNFGTVHGADLSGKETAQDIIKVSKL